MDNRELEKKIGYNFKNKKLLTEALTHSSYANERQDGTRCNERLEFLGDSVLGFISAEHFFHHFKHLPEGELTKRRAYFVCEKSLSEFARTLGGVDGEIAVERETLSVEPRSHKRHQNARRTHERHHFYAVPLCNSHHIGTGAGDSGASCLANHTHIVSSEERGDKRFNFGGLSVAIESEKSERIDVDFAAAFFEETARAPHVLHDEKFHIFH